MELSIIGIREGQMLDRVGHVGHPCEKKNKRAKRTLKDIKSSQINIKLI